MNKRIPKILKINRINKKRLEISVLFSNGEDRILDFHHIFKKVWKVTKTDPEYKLLRPDEFAKVKVEGYSLCWDNVKIKITGTKGKKKTVGFDVGADTLFDLSTPDETMILAIGSLLKQARQAANLSQEEVAHLSGTSRTYITRLENNKQDIEIMTLKKIVEAGLCKKLEIAIR